MDTRLPPCSLPRPPHGATEAAFADAGPTPELTVRTPRRPDVPRLADAAQFAALLDRQLGECRRYGARAAVLLLEVEPQGDGAQSALAGEAREALLQALGARLQARVRGTDVVSRIGEQCFGLVLMSAGRPEAEVVRARLHKALCGPYGVEAQRLYAVLRMGTAVYRESGMSGRELVQAAEATLHGASTAPQAHPHPPLPAGVAPQLSLVRG